MLDTPHEGRLLSQAERMQYMLDLSAVVKETGEHVTQLGRDRIFDTVEVARHQFSTVDAEAGSKLRASLTRVLGEFPGTILEESDIAHTLLNTERVRFPLLLCDAVEGSTNAKRGLAAYLRRPILAGTLAMLLESETLKDLAASAFYDFASGQVFASVRTEPGSFLAFRDGQIIPHMFVEQTQGDSHAYAIVPGYSHGNIEARAHVERALLTAGIESAGGSRSSAQDLVNLLCNQADAYVDLRAHFPGGGDSRDEVLHTWDVGGLLPILDSVGFRITDAVGRCWQQLKAQERLALVITRPSLFRRVRDALDTLPFVAHLLPPQEGNIVRYPAPAAQG